MNVAKKFKGLSRELIALRIANELEDGTYVNLGIGIPTLVSDWIEGRDIILQAELGMLNTGPLAAQDQVEQDLINASCQPVTEMPGSCYFSENESFSMIRGGYMDAAVLGALPAGGIWDSVRAAPTGVVAAVAGWYFRDRKLYSFGLGLMASQVIDVGAYLSGFGGAPQLTP